MEEEASNTPKLPLHGRVAIVTGASRGIGREIALHLASLGANLVLNYNSSSTQADLLANEIINSSSDSQAITVQADVSDPLQVKKLFDEAEKAFNTNPHILVTSAGVLNPQFPTIANTTVEDWDTIFNINTRGTFLCCQEAANRLTRGGGGRIITVSSSVVGRNPPGFAAYAASKAAVDTMTRILAKELKGTTITANSVAPGPTATDMFLVGRSEEEVKGAVEGTPLGRIGETKDIAPLVGFLASDAGEWINGQVIRINGGFVV
ncbi:NADPH-dependent aldehyde reductase-like protein, chloroplastic [Telopea speciosissima]|uniref:NADPH-dependent aldehyde reductase-like protein, chloroplastic n=1 Tax=Telopea speciosissima TaxID=54955 RepID=UPI001CC483FC|nr:NADPH-dependent aldehyde reductase-like protein, chloroplastic [Telopea speciosissima]